MISEMISAVCLTKQKLFIADVYYITPFLKLLIYYLFGCRVLVAAYEIFSRGMRDLQLQHVNS